MTKIFATVMLATAISASASLTVSAAEIVVNMKNKGADGAVMVFEPSFVRAAVGDTIKCGLKVLPILKARLTKN